ncbi:hypothetical protein FOA52_012120 [Chlamydomonas sp. UWO 241]|nr:hypothetical protein FOA52_012120 [Chlamydomonas sp. UWO 241]
MQEDPVRILRGVRFMLRFGLTADPATMDHMRTFVASCVRQGPMHIGYLARPSDRQLTSEARPSRVWRELAKIAGMEPSHPGSFSTALRLYQQIGLLALLFPFLKDSGPAFKAWQVHQGMPVGLPLELRVASLADPCAGRTALVEAADLVQRVRDSLKEGRPDAEAVQVYRKFAGAVWGLYSVPQTVHKGVWVMLLAHRHSQHFIDMLACWLLEMDVQQHMVAGTVDAAGAMEGVGVVKSVEAANASGSVWAAGAASAVEAANAAGSVGKAGSEGASGSADAAGPAGAAEAADAVGTVDAGECSSGAAAADSDSTATSAGRVSGESDAAAAAEAASASEGASACNVGSDDASTADATDECAPASSGGANASKEPPTAPAPAGAYRSLFVSKMSELRSRWAGDIEAARAAAEAAALRGRGRTSEVMERVVSTHGHQRSLHTSKQP